MFDQLIIRDANLDDLPAIVEIYNSTIPSRMVTADVEPVTVETRIPWFNDHSPDVRPLWVVEDEGQICAWLSFQSFYGRPAYQHTAEISIYIHEQFRGKKLGRFLMEKAEIACAKLNIKTILGFIFAHNEPSIRLFTKFGFEKWAHLPRVAELDGVERDLIIMGKRID
ncbi:GNAT family N-acetyltransferase [Neobacillus muris]|uniref:GNAT family N-acetyltransferase n=1 Tax=Neobacillus muris TaxID=2941334 RepID=UPI00203C1DDC|nr:GNAT family N-acetyltransferase [Neobacillus muris]